MVAVIVLSKRYSFVLQEFAIMAGGGGPSSGTVESPLSQAYGYGIVVSLGFLFSLGTSLTT
jgi:hypothetical protein